MPTIASSQLPPPANWDEFEIICADLFKEEWRDRNVVRHGRSGQRQNGVDLYGRPDGAAYAGVQCKGRRIWPVARLTTKEIDEEVKKAYDFKPPLREFIIVTTADDDANIQAHARAITARHQQTGLFDVHVYGWGTLCRKLTSHSALVEKHYGFVAIGELKSSIRELPDIISGVTNASIEQFRIVATSGASSAAYIQSVCDQAIRDDTQRITRARHLNGFPLTDDAMRLATRVARTELAGGSNIVRARALAVCARYLSQGETLEQAREFLDLSRRLHSCEEATIAEAFLLRPDTARSLGILSQLSTPAARSAALRIVLLGGEQSAREWVEAAGLSLDNFDADGKLAYLQSELNRNNWQGASEIAARITEGDLDDAPVLNHLVAMAHLTSVVPTEFRASLLSQVPLEAKLFPLASTDAALDARRKAATAFTRVANYARSEGAIRPAREASHFALWLTLRDPDEHGKGFQSLEDSMRDPDHSLRRLPLAFDFGLPVDLAVIESEINRRVALSGGGDADEAMARFAMVFAQPDSAKRAEYFSRHREHLYRNLNKPALQMLEVEVLARAGMTRAASDLLAESTAQGLGQAEQTRLSRIIGECNGADPAAERKRAFETTGDLRDLLNLVSFLEDKLLWQELEPYAAQLFTHTNSLEDAIRAAIVYRRLNKYSALHVFLASIGALIPQSFRLRTLWAWSLYREGSFAEASEVLAGLVAQRDDPGDRQLRLNIAIASAIGKASATISGRCGLDATAARRPNF